MRVELDSFGSAGEVWLRRDSLTARIKVERQVTAIRWLGIMVGALVGPILWRGQTLHVLWAICASAAAYCVFINRYVLRRRPEWLANGPLMIAVDAVMVGAAVAFSEGLHSEFWLFYFPIAVVAAVRFGRKAALVCIAVIGVSYVTVIRIAGTPLDGIAVSTVLFRLALVTMTSLFAGFVVSRAREAEQRLARAYSATLSALSTALDERDLETEGHSLRVAAYARRLARELGLDGAQVEALERGALLHDVGKIRIPDSILRKRGPLDPDEWAVMRQHPALGRRILAGVPALADALPVVLHHHEWWDGRGYPDGLCGEEIELVARLFAIVDAYDAMTVRRPYRPAGIA